MADLMERKVGIVSCSGEELAEGTVARLAALKVLNELRPRDTVTICLPLFLAGGAGDRAFARLHPTITVDGCDLRCAAHGTEKYSSKPAASLVVNDLVAECGLERPEGRRRLNAAGQKAVEVTAERVAALVDQALGKEAGTAPTGEAAAHEPDGEQREATCSCGSGVPVAKVSIDGQTVELVALPLIFRQFREKGRRQDEGAARELFETVKIYNAVPAEAEGSYREAVAREYAAFCAREKQA
ncbi:MAG TPA: putative zinc-binding protein [Terriglobia bacterium]|nr:putative zinc-binding protein [Terriglobia bacterium]